MSHAGVDIGDEAEEAAGTDPLALTCDEVVPWKTLSAQQRERWWPEALAVLERLETAHGLLRFDSNPGNFALRLRRGRSGGPVQSDAGAEGAGGGAAAAGGSCSVVLLDMKTLLTLEQHARNLFHPENHPLPTAAAVTAAGGGCTARGFFQRALGADDAVFDDGLVVELALQADLGGPGMARNFDPTGSSDRPLQCLGGEDLVEVRRAELLRAIQTAWAVDASGWGSLSPADAFGRLLAILQAVGLTYIRLKLGMLCRKFRGMAGDTFLTDVPRRPASYGC